MKHKLILIVIILFAAACKKKIPDTVFITPTATTEWKAGEVHDIEWEPQGWGNIVIILQETGGDPEDFLVVISAETPDDGLFENWEIPDFEDDVIVYITIADATIWGTVKKFSSANFIIK